MGPDVDCPNVCNRLDFWVSNQMTRVLQLKRSPDDSLLLTSFCKTATNLTYSVMPENTVNKCTTDQVRE